MIKVLRPALLVCAALIFCGSEARANSIGPTCGTCQGSIYTLDILGLAPVDLSADGSFDTYRVALSIDTSGYTGTGVRIDEVAVKISSAVDQAKLVSAPGGVGVWQLLAGGISSGGCNGTGAGFECSDWIVGSTGGAFIPGPVMTWVFDIDINGPLFSFTSANPDLLPTIKARYVDASDNKVGALVSETVPEPTTLGLLAVGMAVAAVRRRRVQL